MEAETLLNSTSAYCSKCKTNEHARIIGRPSGVYMERMCPVLGIQSIRIALKTEWYTQRMSLPQTKAVNKGALPSSKGCPQDCGLCEWHTGSLHLPVFSITNDCNLDCPKCFTHNRPDRKYYKSVEDTKKILSHIVKVAPNVQLVNMTGGEPTLHPELPQLLKACRESGIPRVTMNSNGLRLAADPKLAAELKASGVQVILSLDTLISDRCIAIQGRDTTEIKLKALSVLEELSIPTTILITPVKGLNDTELPELIGRFITKSFVRSITIQNMTYTGKNGSAFSPRVHQTIEEIEDIICTDNRFSKDDFFPLASYHPLCYSVAYYLAVNGKLISLSKLLDISILTRLSENRYLLEPEQDFSVEFMAGINRYWAETGDDELVSDLTKLTRTLFPADRSCDLDGRRKLMEEHVKMIYIHPHMDEDNFDIDRTGRCGDLVPDETGRMIPACSYNLLYREKDPRFWVEPS